MDLKGLYHFVNGKKISKYDLINIFNKIFRDNKIKVKKDSSYKIDKSLISTRDDFDYIFSSYNKMIIEMKNWMLSNYKIYRH